jgi:hypothetical protein
MTMTFKQFLDEKFYALRAKAWIFAYKSVTYRLVGFSYDYAKHNALLLIACNEHNEYVVFDMPTYRDTEIDVLS